MMDASKYRVGYFPDMRAHSMTMSTDADDNRYFFLYTIPEEIKYRVTHTLLGHIRKTDWMYIANAIHRHYNNKK